MQLHLSTQGTRHLMRNHPKSGSRAPLGACQELNMVARPVEGKALKLNGDASKKLSSPVS